MSWRHVRLECDPRDIPRIIEGLVEGPRVCRRFLHSASEMVSKSEIYCACLSRGDGWREDWYWTRGGAYIGVG